MNITPPTVNEGDFDGGFEKESDLFQFILDATDQDGATDLAEKLLLRMDFSQLKRLGKQIVEEHVASGGVQLLPISPRFILLLRIMHIMGDYVPRTLNDVIDFFQGTFPRYLYFEPDRSGRDPFWEMRRIKRLIAEEIKDAFGYRSMVALAEYTDRDRLIKSLARDSATDIRGVLENPGFLFIKRPKLRPLLENLLETIERGEREKRQG